MTLYDNGDEELYDEVSDPYEWTNLASDPKYDGVKADLAKVFPKVNRAEVVRRKRRQNDNTPRANP